MKIIRLAKEEDMEQIHSIYAWYVDNSTATFAYHAPSLTELKEQWKNIHTSYPYLVCEEDNKVLGYAYAHRFRDKEAYQWDVELTIYVHRACTRQNAGFLLMEKLLELLQYQGFHKAYSCITVPNDASLALHERFQFKTIGTFQRTGYKQGEWLDVIWMERDLGQTAEAKPCLPIDACKAML